MVTYLEARIRNFELQTEFKKKSSVKSETILSEMSRERVWKRKTTNLDIVIVRRDDEIAMFIQQRAFIFNFNVMSKTDKIPIVRWCTLCASPHH